MHDTIVDLQVSRRSLLQAGGAAMAATGTLGTAGLFSSDAAAAEIAALKAQGWSSRPIACCMCGAFCGLLALKKDGEPVSEKTVRIFPNPDHPQRGYCGRAAATMWIWNHPLRIKKPLKRTGERGEGKFVEVSWDEALNDIAKRLKAVVEKDGEAAVTSTSHTFSSMSKWITLPLGSPNDIGHAATCNSGSIAGREWVFGKGFNSAGKIEPDYAHLRYLMLVGRTMGSAMGAMHSLNEARARGAKVVSVDPRMPDIAYGDVKWVPIRPGTDSALLLAMMQVLIREKRADFDFVAHHTSGAYLIDSNGAPVTEAMCVKGGSSERFAVMDKATGRVIYQGVKYDAKGVGTAFENEAADPDLYFEGNIASVDGSAMDVHTAFVRLTRMLERYTPAYAARITGIPADQITALARNFADFKGVVDDGWYSSKNGNDVATYRNVNILNALNGNIDREGGLVVTAGAGFRSPSVSAGKGPNGETWEMSPQKRIDRIVSPATSGNFWTALEGMITGKPYPIRAAFIVGSTMFHRESDSTRLAAALKALDLLVVQDLMPHEVVDYADYVLPATFYLERREIGGVKWALDGSVHISDAGIRPPQGVEARHDVWILLEVLRRAFPERAARVGYTECKTADEFDAWWNRFDDAGMKKFLADQEAKKPGSAEAIRKHLDTHGWVTVNRKKYGQYPYVKPFGTITGKVEIFSFTSALKKGYGAVPTLAEFEKAPAYTAPQPMSDEFVLVSGKNSSTCSGLAMFAASTRMLGDRTVWMNPTDAARLKIKAGDMIEVTGVDRAMTATARVTVTKKVIAGSVFAHGFSGAVRTKHLVNDPRFAFVKEGINSHWYATGYAEPVVGNLANNACVRIRRIAE